MGREDDRLETEQEVEFEIGYTYDLDSNRLSKAWGGVTWHYLYDRTDQLVSENTGGQPTVYAYG